MDQDYDVQDNLSMYAVKWIRIRLYNGSGFWCTGQPKYVRCTMDYDLMYRTTQVWTLYNWLGLWCTGQPKYERCTIDQDYEVQDNLSMYAV